MPELSVILPVLNEESIIEPVVRTLGAVLQDARIDYELLLVENKSSDRSLQVIQELAKKESRVRALEAPFRGWGIAVLTGQRDARGTFIAHMQSDGQVDPGLLVNTFRACRAGQADLVKATRVVRAQGFRRVNSWIYNALASLVFGFRLTDANGCPKVYSAHLPSKLGVQSVDNFIDLEMLVKAKRAGLKVVELPTEERDRAGGRSNIKVRTTLEFLKNMIRLRLSLLRS